MTGYGPRRIPFPTEQRFRTTSMLYVILDNEMRIASRERSHGDPSVTGIGLCNLLEDHRMVESLMESIPRCRSVTSGMIREQRLIRRYGWEDDLRSAHPDYVDLSGPWLLEEIIIRKGDILIMNEHRDRRLDDWAYVVDLDSGRMEVHRGFNMARVLPDERFYDGSRPNDGGFYPFKQLFSFSLNNIPPDDDFIKMCEWDRKPQHPREWPLMERYRSPITDPVILDAFNRRR
ncbi:MAG: hypothetical protein IJX35_03060 [Candidatus Methanomethylophilaceae archaeon]|nr:hypothetical protein [Candidatus Methanomethylophilaceae archaeon]